MAIARAIVNDPLLVIADEPTGNLDPETSMEIMNIFSEVNKRGATIIMATHDKTMVDYMQSGSLPSKMVALSVTISKESMVMSFSTKWYYLKETFTSLKRNSLMSIASVTTVALSILVLGLFLTMVLNVNNLAQYLENQVQVTVYMSDAATSVQRRQVEQQLKTRGASWKSRA